MEGVAGTTMLMGIGGVSDHHFMKRRQDSKDLDQVQLLFNLQKGIHHKVLNGVEMEESPVEL
jgi:hypothetical protein